MDRVTSVVRSRTMAAIKGRGTSIERALESLITKSRFAFLKHPKWLGSPDFAFPKRGVVVFVDSCFWHKCPIHYRPPKSRVRYWRAKIGRNEERDLTIRARYKAEGWYVANFWEHEVIANPRECADRLISALRDRKRKNLVPPPPSRTPGGGVPFR
jgi:DNA mismatch endonuclease, patch repair protein